MKLKILGCSGGIGGRHLRTTSLLIDHDILIDAGTGVADLSMAELSLIDHLFLTHTHLDHIAALPLMLDTVGDRRPRPLTVHASEAAITILKNHIFNWAIWPDFSEIPSPEKPFLRFETMETGQSVVLDDRTITALPAEHTVPACGYLLASATGSLAFSGDTSGCDAFWQQINRVADLKYLLIECAFSNRESELARLSRHFCPQTLAAELEKLERDCEVYITHLKPGQIELTMEEIESCLGAYQPRMLQNNQVFEF